MGFQYSFSSMYVSKNTMLLFTHFFLVQKSNYIAYSSYLSSALDCLPYDFISFNLSITILVVTFDRICSIGLEA